MVGLCVHFQSLDAVGISIKADGLDLILAVLLLHGHVAQCCDVYVVFVCAILSTSLCVYTHSPRCSSRCQQQVKALLIIDLCSCRILRLLSQKQSTVSTCSCSLSQWQWSNQHIGSGICLCLCHISAPHQLKDRVVHPASTALTSATKLTSQISWHTRVTRCVCAEAPSG